MFVGENSEANASNNGTEVVPTPEYTFEQAINDRDDYKRRLDGANFRANHLSNTVSAAKELLESLIEGEALDSSYVTVDTDIVKELCEALGVELEVEIEMDITISASVTVRAPRGTTAADLAMLDIFDITIASNDSDYEVEGFGIDDIS